MHGNHGFGLEQTAGVGRFKRTHGENITYGQHGQIRLVQLLNDGHIAEYIGITGMVNFQAILKVENKTARLTAIQRLLIIFNGAGVIGADHGDFNVPNLLCAAFVHGSNMFGAFFIDP